ncbi:unnamed protein product [Brachionus calyciflorus]|uniref:Apple domain-containing protein n=1 Tax=Brachionus calyciflorus TaxID=104777 RepID=A0A813M5E6_9BILA|nr:unnamed protein product [Brachionus calyciflorus]
MKSLQAIILLCGLVFLSLESYNAQPFCSPLIPNIDPNNLPKLPQEFQTRIELNILHENRSEDLFVKFDWYDKKAEIIKRERAKTSRTVFFFDKNEVFYIEQKQCSAMKLNESSSNIFFGLAFDGTTYNMQESNYFFHFNNGYPTVKVETTSWRDIPATRFQSCQNWPEVNGNVLIDYYFSNPNHGYPINYYQGFKELPIAIMIEGFININTPDQKKIKIEYNFFEFRTAIERKFDLFTLPSGVYCNGQTIKEEIPQIPDSFSFSEEIIAQRFNFETNSRVHYSKPLKAVRYDFEGSKIISPWFIEGSYKAIHDFNSGVGYAINIDNKNCLMYPMGTLSIDRNDIFPTEKGFESIIQLKNPEEFFYLDDSYVYAGQRYERDIFCDVFVSRRTDIKVGNFTNIPVLVEFFFQNLIANYDEGSDKKEQVVPLSVHVTIEANGLKIVNHIYNFDSELYKRKFDISECFNGKDKVLFGMRFRIPEGMDKEEFEKKYGRVILEPFEKEVMKSFGSLEYSPLRIVPSTIEFNRDSFTINSGITATAPAINHFRKMDNTRIDNSKARYTYRVDSPDKCASLCLNKDDMKSVTNNPDFNCRSFDFCTDTNPSDFLCSFYNLTISDQDVTSESADVCEHYSKSTKEYDSATVDELYGSLKEAVLRKQFKFDYQTESKAVLTFDPTDIFDANQQTNGDSSSGFGFTSFFERFDTFLRENDLNETYINQNPSVFLRKKSLITIDECSRLCITEPTFDCQTISYNDQTQECKWSSLLLLTPNSTVFATSIQISEESTILIRDPLYNYIEYPFKVTALVDYSVTDVSSPNECAFNCDKESNLKCRSFNLCKKDDEKYRCLLSNTNIHNTEKDPNVVYSAICSHYSKRAITDFELAIGTQLSVTPQTTLKNSSIEGCAEICSLQDSFFCRSFDFEITTRTCYLYEENLKDKKFIDLGIKSNPNFEHYSRLYYEENGILKQIQPKTPKSGSKYGAGTIIGVVIAVLIAGLLVGIAIGFAYTKFTNRANLLPVMKFTNPNYQEKS